MSGRRIRVGIHQAAPGSGLSDDALRPYREAAVELLLLPEYFWVRPEDGDHTAAAAHAAEDLAFLSELSRREDWLIGGGTIVEETRDGWHNAFVVFRHGMEIGRYRKQHLMPGERDHGAVPGESFVLLEASGIRIAPVICADVLHEDTFAHVAALEPDLILAPMASPYLAGDTVEAKERRDREIFVAGAERAGAPIVKACGVGTLFGRPLQGRSLVTAPGGVVFRTPFDEELEPRSWIVDVPLARA